MQTEPQKQEVNVRTYFLQQGQSITKLHEVLDSSLLAGHLKRGLSFLIELILFLVFLALLLLVIYIPLDPIQIHQQLSETTWAQTTIHNDDVTGVMTLIKGVIFLASLMPLLLMFLLRRNRVKRALINEAFKEVELMKKQHNKAMKELPLK